jgi:DNA-binding LytR/AlgR family response regulator
MSPIEVLTVNILICDDVRSEADKLSFLINTLGYENNIVCFYNARDTLDYVRSGAVVDVCLLDIIMPDTDGIELAEQLRKDGYTGKIVFLSASHEYGPATYTVDAFTYLLKPPKIDDLRCLMRKLEEAKANSDTSGIHIKVSKVSRHLLFREISHAEVIKHYVYFRLTDGREFEIYTTFGEIAPQLLRDNRFTQCHRSYIVNMDDISAIDDKEITMRSGVKIPNSKSYPDVKKKFARWIGR